MDRQKEIREMQISLELLAESTSVGAAMDAYLAASQQLGQVFRAQIKHIVDPEPRKTDTPFEPHFMPY